jgi:hypothetical protein
MILPEFVLPSQVNQVWTHSGLDTAEFCLNPTHFHSYAHAILYEYNSRGYRDQEWPNSIEQLKNSIWCMGDSFTVGIGSPREHTWPWILQQATQQRTINVSMDGASNNWIARKALEVLDQIQPKHMVLHWSYISRRENDMETALDQHWQEFYKNARDASWPDCTRKDLDKLPEHIRHEITAVHGWNMSCATDEQRVIPNIRCTDQDDVDNTLQCIEQIEKFSDRVNIIHSFIPEFVPKRLKNHIESQIQGQVIPELSRQDLARDGHHYDVKTSQWLVDQIMPLLN